MEIIFVMISCVLVNHLGLISGIEKVAKHSLPIVNCVKCSTFWFCLLYGLFSKNGIVFSIMISLTLSYVAIWLELLCGYIDSIYGKIYNKIYKESSDKEDSCDTNTEDSESTVS